MNYLSNKALLVVLNISQWTGRKYDRNATTKVESDFSTQGKVGQYTKKLLPKCLELDRVNQVQAKIRGYFYEQSLPWFTDGSRIISSKNYMAFTAEFRKLKSEFDTAVNDFIREYPVLIAAAKIKLGDLFNAIDYPNEERIKLCFSCDVHFMPIPDVKDFRIEISDEEKDEFTKKMQSVESQAMKEVWSRLYEVVNKAASRLNSPDAIIKNSLIENIQEVCQLLPKLNLNDDTSLETMRLEVEKTIAGINPDVCRNSDLARQDGAKALNEALNKMSVFMA